MSVMPAHLRPRAQVSSTQQAAPVATESQPAALAAPAAQASAPAAPAAPAQGVSDRTAAVANARRSEAAMQQRVLNRGAQQAAPAQPADNRTPGQVLTDYTRNMSDPQLLNLMRRSNDAQLATFRSAVESERTPEGQRVRSAIDVARVERGQVALEPSLVGAQPPPSPPRADVEQLQRLQTRAQTLADLRRDRNPGEEAIAAGGRGLYNGNVFSRALALHHAGEAYAQNSRNPETRYQAALWEVALQEGGGDANRAVAVLQRAERTEAMVNRRLEWERTHNNAPQGPSVSAGR